MLTRLDVHNVRNLNYVSLRDLGAVSVFYGSNGSGKSSLLEAAHMLGMGRSFRGVQPRSLINHQSASCVVHGEVKPDEGSGLGVVLGVSRDRSGAIEVRVGGKSGAAVAQLAQALPLQVLEPSSFELLVGPPAQRRRFLDWGVFHVEHAFLTTWRRFQRSLQQRNALLRNGRATDSELRVWSTDVAQQGEALASMRRAYFERLEPLIVSIHSRLAPDCGPLRCGLRQGWDGARNLEEALIAAQDSDKQRGFTQVGPQRADLRFQIDGVSAADVLSRGQQKLLICALKLAQGQLHRSLPGRQRQCLYLLDDLAAELDAEHLNLVCTMLDEMNAQVFITTIDPGSVIAAWPTRRATTLKMFHVEHGMIRPV